MSDETEAFLNRLSAVAHVKKVRESRYWVGFDGETFTLRLSTNRHGRELAEFSTLVERYSTLPPSVADYMARRSALAPFGTLQLDRESADSDEISIRITHRILVGTTRTADLESMLDSMSFYRRRARRRLDEIIQKLLDEARSNDNNVASKGVEFPHFLRHRFLREGLGDPLQTCQPRKQFLKCEVVPQSANA